MSIVSDVFRILDDCMEFITLLLDMHRHDVDHIC